MADTLQEQTNVSTTVRAHTTAVESEKEGNGFVVPEAYRDKPYMKGINSEESLYKAFDGAQSLIGKQKITFPTNETSDEDRLAFNLAAGMPEKAEDYVFEREQGTETDTEYENKVKQLFHNSGLSGKSATKLQVGFEKLINELQVAEKTRLDTEFNELSSKTFGDNSDSILAEAKNIIKENIPDGFADHFTNLDNQALVTMAAVVDKIKTRYIDEDSINDRGANIGASGVDDLRKKGRDLLNHPARSDAFHPDHKRINEEIKENYAMIGKMLT